MYREMVTSIPYTGMNNTEKAIVLKSRWEEEVNDDGKHVNRKPGLILKQCGAQNSVL